MLTVMLVVAAIAAAYFFLRRPAALALLDLPEGALGSPTNPVKCGGPAGEMEYLLRLRGPDGKGAGYRRMGTVEKGALGHVLDVYAVASGDERLCWKVHLDMYFMDHRETQPIQGFTMVDKPSVHVPGLDPSMQSVYRLIQSKAANAPDAPPSQSGDLPPRGS